MPHYADGKQAKVGDFVTGPLYNSKGIKAGTIVSITPGQDTCNAKVRFVEVTKKPDGYGTEEHDPYMCPLTPRMAVAEQVIKTEAHGTDGPEMVRYDCEDYCEVKALTLIAKASGLPPALVGEAHEDHLAPLLQRKGGGPHVPLVPLGFPARRRSKIHP